MKEFENFRFGKIVIVIFEYFQDEYLRFYALAQIMYETGRFYKGVKMEFFPKKCQFPNLFLLEDLHISSG